MTTPDDGYLLDTPPRYDDSAAVNGVCEGCGSAVLADDQHQERDSGLVLCGACALDPRRGVPADADEPIVVPPAADDDEPLEPTDVFEEIERVDLGGEG